MNAVTQLNNNSQRQLQEEQQPPAPPTNTLKPHPTANLIRPMTDEEFASLKEDIRVNRLREPIKLLDGKIIDGRHRQRACEELGIPPDYEEIETSDPKAFVHSLNVTRRHLTTLERARLANDVATQKPGGDRRSNHSASLPDGLSQEEAAKKHCVSVRTMRQVRRIDDAKGEHFDVIEDLEKGGISIGNAYEKIRTPSAKQRPPTTGDPEWSTPPEYIEAAGAVMGGIDLDPASCEAANEMVKATRFFTKDDDALNQEWAGRVWMNPPYSHPICGQLIDKLLDSPKVDQAIVLCQDSTDTNWWQELAARSAVYGFATKRIEFTPGRGNKGGSPVRGSTIFGIGVDPRKFMVGFESLCHSFNMGERPLRQVNAVEPPAEKKLVAAVENGEVGTEQAANKLADREARRNRNLKAERKREERANLPASDGMDIYHCSCGELAEKVEAATVDVICTDPPYGKEFLPCWSELAEFAAHALRSGGQLLALSGQAWLPEVIDRLRVDGLTYRWTLALEFKGGRTYRSFNRSIRSDWKPFLVFEKPGERRLGGHFPLDVVKATETDAESKQRHPWGQDHGAFRDLLGKFADPGMMVCDPFVGGGTTAVVARELGCSFIGCDIDADCVATTWDAVPGLPVAA